MKKIHKEFEKEYFDLNSAINKSYIDNGVGCLAVKIKKFSDVISRYSGKGYECLNHEFYSYLDRNLKYIPDNVPILVQIYGCKLKQKEKEIIVENVREHYQYKLGEVIEANNAKMKRIAIYFALAIIFLILSIVTEKYEMLSDFLNLAFWFYGSTVVTYFAVDIRGTKKARARAGQIANMFILIDEKLDTNPITEKDKEIIYSKINNKK